ncbi:probable serine hydrolase isoform X2 [Anthonomus grandis grandis]|uniref:probable serine hydrolase isoform X2 n=1 Tax=Anthonomus grandis grandis TaxID=2921223 RepID=UPI002165A546|nr:probable serine hydrolase isoform X2 [Anthonomus grandis grandis]
MAEPVMNGNLAVKHEGELSIRESKSSKVTGLDDFQEVTIPVPWGHIAGKWWGPQNTQPIIAIHGWQDNCGTFDKVAPLLKARGHSVLCIDLPGHGFSSHLAEGHKYYIWWDGVHYLRRIVKYFKWSDIIVLGHSLGGGIAFLYAAVYPKEVRKYISIDLASPSVRDLKKSCDVLGYAIDKFLSYEMLTQDSVPCYPYNEMLDILVDAHKGSVTREGCEILLKRGMKPAKDKEGHFYFTRDPRLKLSALGFLTLEQVMELASRIICYEYSSENGPKNRRAPKLRPGSG